jgi:1-acyl-sn-glycerol-3-phosphate acyltransferase
LNAAVAVYIYTLVPEFLLRLLAWILVRFVYRLHATGIGRVPESGPALVLCNHVSFVDPLMLSAACPRPMRFVMEASIFRVPVLSLVFRGVKAISVASAREDRAVRERAFAAVAAALRAGEVVCIFPEGQLTQDGSIGQFKAGVLRVLSETPVPVVPVGLSGLWGSMFSRRHREVWKRWPRALWPRVDLRAGAPLDPAGVTLQGLREEVARLRGPTP